MRDFRSVDFWKESIMILPDAAFFELLRTVFGKIKTPFSKQILLNDLEKFLLGSGIQRNIAAFIDNNDARIIAAVAALNEPSSAELAAFFAGDIHYAKLHDLVVNLEERFIVYRFLDKEQKQGVNRLALNPVLKPVLEPFIADHTLLFPSVDAGEILCHTSCDMTHDTTCHVPQAEVCFFDDRILAALLSFVAQNQAFFRHGGGLRQKLTNAAKLLFPGLPLEMVIGSLRVLGLFFAKEDLLLPDYSRVAAFGRLKPQERMEYFAAGIICLDEAAANEDLSSWLLRSKVYAYAAAIHRFNDSLDAQRLYPPATLRKLACLLDDIQVSYKTKDSDISGTIIGAMERAGMLIRVSDQYWRKLPPADTPADDSPLIAMDTPATFLMYPGIAYNDAVTLASVSSVIEAGSAVRFELSRDSAVSAFDRGMSAQTIIELMRRLSHNRIDENLIFSLQDWEKRYSEVTLRRGLVLTLSPEQRHLSQTRALARLITETLAPGVYLLPETAEDKAAEALRKAGVTIIARRGEFGNRAADTDLLSGSALRNFFPPLQSGQTNDGTGTPDPRSPDAGAKAAAELIEELHSILNKTRPGGEDRDELTARINRRLILCESQLKGAVVRYEKLEARGLDYVGKALIAKQAVSLQSPVEIVWPGKQRQEPLFGIPKGLEKAEGESILLVDLADSGEIARIPLGKISLLRRIKKSIFEG